MTTVAASGLWPPQRRAVQFLRSLGNCGALGAEVGVGKTSVAAVVSRPYRRVLIVTPVSSLGVWRKEALRLGLSMPVLTLDSGSSAQKIAQVRAFGDGWIVTNYETFWRPPLFAALADWGPQYVIWDEFQRLRYHTSKQSKEAAKLRQWKTVQAAVGLSGTPITKGYEGLFGMFRAVNPNVFGLRWGTFLGQYVNMVNMGDYNKVIGYKNTDDLFKRLDKNMIQIAKSEALPWLPKERDVFVPVELTPESRKRYREFAREAVMQISGESDGYTVEGTALARIALTTLLRLQQLTSGFIKTEDEGELIVSDEKLRACVDLVRTIRDSEKSVVIFYRFNMDRKRLEEALSREMKERIAVLMGEMKPRDQQLTLDRFFAKKDRIILCQIHKAIGINELVAASDAIFYSTGYSLEDFVQAKGRIHRPGQTEPVTYYHLIVERSVDEKVYAALQANIDLARSFIRLDYARGFLADEKRPVD